jgi:hypothetical protein
VLDPRISEQALKDDFAGDEDLLLHLETSKESLDDYFKINYVKFNIVSDVVTPTHLSVPGGSPQKDFTARYRVQRQRVLDELREYFNLPHEDFVSCDPVEWWTARQAQFPNLWRLARDFMTIPGTRTPPIALKEVLTSFQAPLSPSSGSFRVVGTQSRFAGCV